jgi:cholesterol oxidase
MVGCRHGAKNSLDRNYLYLAERGGARVFAERQVVDVVPLPGGGWEVVAERPGAWARRRRETLRAEQVVLAAGVLGTLRLLFAARRRGRLPRLSPRLGEGVRTNSETLVGATAPTREVDYSRGVAIGSSIHPNQRTHVEPVRYPRGSNAMGLLGTLLVDGGGRVPRPVRWLAEAARHPVTLVRSLSVYRWSERTIILLVMQAKPGSLRVRERRRLPGFGFRLTTSQTAGEPSPTFIPEANEAARVTADVIGGVAGSALNEVLLNVPTTAHILGGACIGTSAENGVVDAYHRVFGHPGLHVVDGSCVGANLGVNPALTITSLAERALSLWPNRGDDDLRPALGAAYRRLSPVAPKRPAVPPGAPASSEALARIGSFE